MTKEIKQIAILDDNAWHRAEAEVRLSVAFKIVPFESSETLFDYLVSNDVNLLLVSAELTCGYFASVITDAHQRWPGLPVILTCEENVHSRSMRDNYTSLAAGVVSKPFTGEELISLVGQTLRDQPFSTCLANQIGE